jgi:hypothetical protein
MGDPTCGPPPLLRGVPYRLVEQAIYKRIPDENGGGKKVLERGIGCMPLYTHDRRWNTSSYPLLPPSPAPPRALPSPSSAATTFPVTGSLNRVLDRSQMPLSHAAAADDDDDEDVEGVGEEDARNRRAWSAFSRSMSRRTPWCIRCGEGNGGSGRADSEGGHGWMGWASGVLSLGAHSTGCNARRRRRSRPPSSPPRRLRRHAACEPGVGRRVEACLQCKRTSKGKLRNFPFDTPLQPAFSSRADFLLPCFAIIIFEGEE